MDGKFVKNVVDACEAKNLNYTIVSMMPSFLRRNQYNIIKVVGEEVYNFRKPIYSENNDVKGIELLVIPIEQLCEFHITANYEDMTKLADELGIDLSNEDKAKLIHMDKYESQIEPETGNYHRFKYITGEAYKLLSDEEKEAYNAAKEEYEAKEEKRLGANQAASISMH